MKDLKMPEGWTIIKNITPDEQHALSNRQFVHDDIERKLNETLERFRYYNNGTEEDILDMIDDWQAEKDAINNEYP
jgi:hypothetical protein